MTDLMPRSVFLSSSRMRPVKIQPKSSVLTSIVQLPGLRIRPENPTHHLWNNHGTWFLHYTVHPTPLTKERIRRSLGTKDLPTAQRRRDAFFAHLAANYGKFAPVAGKEAAA